MAAGFALDEKGGRTQAHYLTNWQGGRGPSSIVFAAAELLPHTSTICNPTHRPANGLVPVPAKTALGGDAGAAKRQKAIAIAVDETSSSSSSRRTTGGTEKAHRVFTRISVRPTQILSHSSTGALKFSLSWQIYLEVKVAATNTTLVADNNNRSSSSGSSNNKNR